MLKEKINILGIEIDKVNMNKAYNVIMNYIKKNKKAMVVTPNAEMIVRAQNNKELKEILNNSELSLPDGAGVLLAAKLQGESFVERVSGFDILVELLTNEDEREISVYFLGGSPGITENMTARLENDSYSPLPSQKKLSSKIKICGYHHGYLDDELKRKVITEINNKNPDILFVGMGVPLQEKFLKNNLDNLNIKVGVTVGGSFDVLAGKINRAPIWMQKIGLEWFYRLLQEPSRFQRMLALPHFVFLVVKESLIKQFQKVES